MFEHSSPRARAVAAAVVLGLVLTTPAFAEQKIGIFDAARVSEETNEGREVQSRLEAFRSAKQAEITSLEQQLAELQNRLNTQALSLSADRRSELEKAIQRKLLGLNQTREAATREMQIEIAEAQDVFQEKLLAVIQTFGRDEGFTVILESTLVAYADQSTDVTTAIVDRFNGLFPGTAAPAPEGPEGGN